MLRRYLRTVLLAAAATAVMASHGRAQTWSPEQREVWEVISGTWEAAMQGDTTWAARSLHERFLGWASDQPAPLGKESMDRWERYYMSNAKTLVQDLHLLGIVVHENTAVAHYYFSTASENRAGERETSHGRFTDVLVREEGTWRLLAWHGGADPN